MTDIILNCPRCGEYVEPIPYEVGPHIRADCPLCNRFIKFLNPKERGVEMPELEIFFKFPDDKYGSGIMLEEYNDRISLVLAQKAQGDGTVYKKWIYPQKRVDGVNSPAEKAIPHKIYLGHDRKEAAEMLRKIAIQLKGS